MDNLLENIRTIRRLKGISQESMAYELGIDYSTYGKIERNQIALTVDRLQKISDIFEMNVEDVLYWGKEREDENSESQGYQDMKSYVKRLNEKIVNYEKELEAAKEELSILKEQIRDKERIIRLMEEQME